MSGLETLSPTELLGQIDVFLDEARSQVEPYYLSPEMRERLAQVGMSRVIPPYFQELFEDPKIGYAIYDEPEKTEFRIRTRRLQDLYVGAVAFGAGELAASTLSLHEEAFPKGRNWGYSSPIEGKVEIVKALHAALAGKYPEPGEPVDRRDDLGGFARARAARLQAEIDRLGLEFELNTSSSHIRFL